MLSAKNILLQLTSLARDTVSVFAEGAADRTDQAQLCTLLENLKRN